MKKLGLFEKLIEELNDKCPSNKPEFKYIGTGNPQANILIIGKEAAIAKDINREQVKREIASNFEQWKNICKTNKINQSIIPTGDFSNYTPLYPYKGQILKIDNGCNKGTSRTWYNYQKLVNFIYNEENNQNIDFHEKVFITEANSSPCQKTKNANTSSIGFRKKILLKSDFIKSFPITLIAGVGYFKIEAGYNEIEDIFDVHFKEKKLAGDKESQPYWTHINNQESKILINCYQLSINVSDALLKEIASEIRKYLK